MEIIQFLTSDALASCLVAIIVGYLVYFIRLVASYPRGPLPLPVIGNVLLFRGKYNDPSPVLQMTEWSKKFGPIYTVWAGHTPVVVVNSFELNTEASVHKRNDFIQRTDALFHELFKSGSQNVVSTNGEYWEALRKVSVFAIRRFLNSERLAEITAEVTDEAIDLMIAQKQWFNPILYIDYIIYNVLALIAFGQKFDSLDNQVFKDAKLLNDQFYEMSGNGMITDYMPWLKPFYYKRVARLRDITKLSVDSTKTMFSQHKDTYQQGIYRDFSDCVLEAKEEAIRENYSRSKFLNDSNLYNVVSDMFNAGTDTTQTTLRWAYLFLANDPALQEEIRKEIVDNIGDHRPTQEDKVLLPLTYAFLLEVLRLKPPTPMGLDHSASVDTELGGHKIPKDTMVIFNLYAQNTDPKYWSDPLTFNPKRFLDSEGNVMTGRLPSFVTFGLGRRACPGEKLALNNAFLILSRLLQKSRLELSTGAGTAYMVAVNVMLGNFPRDYQIKCYPMQ